MQVSFFYYCSPLGYVVLVWYWANLCPGYLWYYIWRKYSKTPLFLQFEASTNKYFAGFSFLKTWIQLQNVFLNVAMLLKRFELQQEEVVGCFLPFCTPFCPSCWFPPCWICCFFLLLDSFYASLNSNSFCFFMSCLLSGIGVLTFLGCISYIHLFGYW